MRVISGYLGAGLDSVGMWRGHLIHGIITITTIGCILDVISAQCSEAHRQTCYLSYVRLQELHEPATPTYRYIPDYNSTTLRNVCRLYNEYRNCSQPFLSSCDDSTVVELHTYDATLGYICSDQAIFNGYLSHKNCFNRLRFSHTTCKQKGLVSMADIDVTNSAFKYTMCRSARDYVLCIYTATALGCSIQAAEVYFNLLNHSIGSMFGYHDYECTIEHPMDVISIYTTTPPTTSTPQTSSTDGGHNAGDNREPYTETSGTSHTIGLSSTYILGCVLFVCFYELAFLLKIR